MFEIKIIFYKIDCTELNCKTCPSDTCTQCYSSYYLYEDHSC